MKLKNDYVLTEIGDEIMAVPMDETAGQSRHIVRLNETGVDIWNGIEAGKNCEEIAESLVEKYDGIDVPSALTYVKKIVNTLAEAGLLEE